MAKENIQPHKVLMTETKREIIRSLLLEYVIQTEQEDQNVLKVLLGCTFKEMVKSETVKITK